jgi:excisionase family DNA binding protein
MLTHEAAVSITEQIEESDHALTASELAQLLSVHKLTIYRAAKAGRLKCFRVGHVVRFEPRAVAAWLKGRAL